MKHRPLDRFRRVSHAANFRQAGAHTDAQLARTKFVAVVKNIIVDMTSWKDL
jgi:hypothetical protein